MASQQIYDKNGNLVTTYYGATPISSPFEAGYDPAYGYSFSKPAVPEPNIILSTTPVIGGVEGPTKTEYFSGSTTIPNAGGGPQTRMDGDARGIILMSNASATSQKSATFGIYINNYTNGGAPGGTLSTSQTSAIDFTSAQTLSAYSSDCVSLYNYSIIVNP